MDGNEDDEIHNLKEEELAAEATPEISELTSKLTSKKNQKIPETLSQTSKMMKN